MNNELKPEDKLFRLMLVMAAAICIGLILLNAGLIKL